MIFNYGYLGTLNNTDLNNIHGLEHNGVFEINDPKSYTDTYNFPNDYQTLSSFFSRGYEGATYYDFIKKKGSNVDPESLLRYNLLLAYDHLRGINHICTGILEVSSTNLFTVQKFTRFPDGVTFTRSYKNNKWSKWRYILTSLLNDLLSEDKHAKVAFKPSRIHTIITTEIPKFDDRPLWDRLNRKMNRDVYDNLVWNDRPDTIYGDTYMAQLYTPYMNFILNDGHPDYGFTIQKYDGGQPRGELWMLRYNKHANELYIGNEWDDGVRNRLWIQEGRHLWNIQGDTYNGHAMFDYETHYRYTGGHGQIVFPYRPAFDIHVFCFNNVFHFVPGVAKRINYWDNAQYMGQNEDFRWDTDVEYDGDRTITFSHGKQAHTVWIDARWL